MEIKLEIASNKLKTENNIKFKYEATKAINKKKHQIQTHLRMNRIQQNCLIIENQIHNKIDQKTG